MSEKRLIGAISAFGKVFTNWQAELHQAEQNIIGASKNGAPGLNNLMALTDEILEIFLGSHIGEIRASIERGEIFDKKKYKDARALLDNLEETARTRGCAKPQRVTKRVGNLVRVNF